MLTLFAVPKAFEPDVAETQERAVASWLRLSIRPQVILAGDDAGVAEAAVRHGVQHVAGAACTAYGTPLLDDVLVRVRELATFDLLCYVSADVILLDDFSVAATRAIEWRPRFLLVGACTDVDTVGVGAGASDDELRALARAGRSRGPKALDYFVFPRDLYGEIPPFALGRAGFDNWLVWKARELGAAVVDATPVVAALHQHHDYSHVSGGFESSYFGEEAQRNIKLAGGPKHLFTLWDATHTMTPDRIRPNPRSWLRSRHRLDTLAGKLRWRLDAMRRRRARQSA
ncbi:MAG: hypothetical protein ACYDHH_22430 [Solirubrobacteraceae bacterium]